MDYRKLCVDIFGTDSPEKLKEFAKKAASYEQLYEKGDIINSRNAGRKPKIGSEDAEKMREMYASGESVGQIAQYFHVTRPTVYKYINIRKRWEEDNFVRVRLDYMYDDELCTVIDVDFKHEKVYVENQTDKVLLTAFGVNKNPDWEAFNDFLESRCVPRTRCGMKRILKENELNSYDPLQMIERTQGRMAEDHHWIRIHYKDGEELPWDV